MIFLYITSSITLIGLGAISYIVFCTDATKKEIIELEEELRELREED